MEDLRGTEPEEDKQEGQEGHDFEKPPEPLVNEMSLETAVIEEDTSHFNYMLKRSEKLWQTNLDADDFCKLANTTMKLLEMRRKMMLLRTERTPDKGKNGTGYFGAFADQ